jgi:uncharacterized protein (TIGR03437 family)
MPIQPDSSSPAHWSNNTLFLFQSSVPSTFAPPQRAPIRAQGADQFQLGQTIPAKMDPALGLPVWIESTWLDPGGRLYAWYHREPAAACPGTSLNFPEIGALRSDDNGASFVDLGVIIRAPASDSDCSSQNGYFAGGNGDFAVILDNSQTFFYIIFTNYGGLLAQQGVGVARMAFADRDSPAGKVFKYRNGQWQDPGIGGEVTPIFPATVEWAKSNADSFWGASVHWNTYLNMYVALMNRSCCAPWFPQEGIYVAFNSDIANPAGWTTPSKILSAQGWYPQILGTGTGETDKLGGQTARFYLAGTSAYQIVFQRPPPPPLSINSAQFPNGTVGVGYSQALAASGGTSPYTWKLASGSLPPGLNLDPSSGRIAGTPNAAGGFNFIAQVTDSAGASASQSFAISIVVGVSISTASLVGGTVGVPYSQVLAAAGGTPPYRWSVSSGSLPPSLNLDPAGAIGGTPSAAGTFSLTIQVTDSGGGTASRAFAVTIAPAVQPLKINTPAALPGGATGSVYLQTFSASGGTPPYNWSLTSGSLPSSLQFNASGILTGTPMVDGNFTFTVQVADAAGATASQSFSLTVAPVAILADAPMLNGASFQASIAPGAIVSIFGTEMALGPQSASAAPLPTNLNGTSVLFNGIPLPLFYVSSSQVNAQVPFEVAAGQAAIALVRGTSISAVKQVTVSPVSPGIFTVNQSGSGAGVVTHANFSLVNASSPAKAGEYLSIFCTGLGALQPPVPTGGVAPMPPPLVTASVNAAIGGVPARVTFAGAAPGFVGLYQVNVQVAPGTPSGSQQPLELHVNGLPANTVTVAVQ